MMQKNWGKVILFAGILSILLSIPVLAQEKMVYEDYLALLDKWSNREAQANDEITKLENEIAALRSQISDTQAEVDKTWEEIYATISSTENTRDEFGKNVHDLKQQIAGFENMSPEEIYQRQDELEALKSRYAEVASMQDGLLSANLKDLSGLGARLAAVEKRMAKPKSKIYTVVRGDYLWKIAGMPEHYNDPMKWMRIYSVNSDQIDDPDLIYANQRFTIPIDISKKQYLVARGDFLYKIAESVYGDPFQWKKIYEGNRGVLEDPNVLYPETILDLPGR